MLGIWISKESRADGSGFTWLHLTRLSELWGPPLSPVDKPATLGDSLLHAVVEEWKENMILCIDYAPAKNW